MIVFDLRCAQAHVFEAWFGSSGDYEDQRTRGLLSCPVCGDAAIEKAVMAPNVAAKGNTRSDACKLADVPTPAAIKAAMAALAEAQAKALDSSTWVGRAFADKARAMHVGEMDQAPIHGEATRDEARALAEEGVPVAALPLPVRPPETLN
jgi:hypothetical protein